MIFPSPPQVGHAPVVCIWPRKVLETLVTRPLPLHVLHVLKAPFFAPEPLQVLHSVYFLTFTFFSTPLTISWSVSLTRMRMFEPLFTLCLLRPPPNPPNPPKSPNPKASPKISPNELNISSILMPPPPNPPDPLTPSWPN